MAVPSSGPLKLRADIALEVDGDATGTNVSLRALSEEAGFSIPDTFREFYGYVSAVIPTLTSSAMDSITATQMRANANVTSDGDATVTERGFYFGTSSTYTSNTKYTVSGTTGAYTRTFTSLSGGTTHYGTAYAINSVGEGVATTRSAGTLNTRTLTITRTKAATGSSGQNSRSARYDVSYTGGGGANCSGGGGASTIVLSLSQNSGTNPFAIGGPTSGVWCTWQGQDAVQVQASGRFTLSVPASSTYEGKSVSLLAGAGPGSVQG